MNVTTKYSIGQPVWTIWRGYLHKILSVCKTCDGTGMVDIRGESYICPACKGEKKVTEQTYAYYVNGHGIVGRVQIETLADHSDPDDDERVTATEDGRLLLINYMLNTTGSGSVHYEPLVFPSREVAQAECDRRNGFKRND